MGSGSRNCPAGWNDPPPLSSGCLTNGTAAATSSVRELFARRVVFPAAPRASPESRCQVASCTHPLADCLSSGAPPPHVASEAQLAHHDHLLKSGDCSHTVWCAWMEPIAASQRRRPASRRRRTRRRAVPGAAPSSGCPTPSCWACWRRRCCSARCARAACAECVCAFGHAGGDAERRGAARAAAARGAGGARPVGAVPRQAGPAGARYVAAAWAILASKSSPRAQSCATGASGRRTTRTRCSWWTTLSRWGFCVPPPPTTPSAVCR